MTQTFQMNGQLTFFLHALWEKQYSSLRIIYLYMKIQHLLNDQSQQGGYDWCHGPCEEYQWDYKVVILGITKVHCCFMRRRLLGKSVWFIIPAAFYCFSQGPLFTRHSETSIGSKGYFMPCWFNTRIHTEILIRFGKEKPRPLCRYTMLF